jgi:hypothetical protein
MSGQDETRVTLSGRRPSASAQAAREAELERIRSMTGSERMDLALALGRRRLALEQRRAEAARVDI